MELGVLNIFKWLNFIVTVFVQLSILAVATKIKEIELCCDKLASQDTFTAF